MRTGQGIRARLLTAAVLSVLIAAMTTASTFAAGTLDQHQEDTSTGVQRICGAGISGVGCPLSEAQTFTAGISGLLDKVELRVKQISGPAPLTVEIRGVDGAAAPGSTVLATGSIPAASSAGWYEVALASMPLVEAGTTYAIVAFTSGATEWGWSFIYSPSADKYVGGVGYTGNGSPPTTWTEAPSVDLAFRTYVSPSADVSLSLVGPSSTASRSTITYIVTVENTGVSTGAAVVVRDNLPFGVQYVTSTTSAGSCTTPSKKVRTVTCELGSMAAGSTATIAITVKVAARAGQSYINNVATVSSNTFDPQTSNNTASVSTAITR